MLLPEVKRCLQGTTETFREEIIVAALTPQSIVENFIQELDNSRQRIAPHLKSECAEHIQNLKDNREEAEKFVAGILGYC